MSENEQETVQIFITIPKDMLDAMKAETFVEANATAVATFLRKIFAERAAKQAKK